jgi:hypothetical protein
MPRLNQGRRLLLCLLMACLGAGVAAPHPAAAPRPKTWSDFPAGPEPKGLAFDGAHNWVANSKSGAVSRRQYAGH